MIFEIELVGGPADGRRIAAEGDVMNPPDHIELLQQNPLDIKDWDENPEKLRRVGFRKLIYRRSVSTSDCGPLWLYRFDG